MRPGEILKARIDPDVDMPFAYVPPGVFEMGSPEDEKGRRHNEGPQHEVEISRGFSLAQYPVTRRQWLAVMGTRPWDTSNHRLLDDGCPATHITWDGAQAFIDHLNERAGERGYRLPTEAEWEYACRAGTTSRWSFGDHAQQMDEYGWYNGNVLTGDLYPQLVGTKAPNNWGLYDMHGNVSDWCADWYGPYPGGPQRDPQGPATGSYRVERGGNFLGDVRQTRSACRSSCRQDFVTGTVGFRLARNS
jgi:formylglycine-generating enzyme required for sulfatase activity